MPIVDLVAGQLAAFARLGALGDLDLQLVGVDEVLGGDAEPGARHLLDRAAAQIAVLFAHVAAGLFSPFAAVRLAAEAVHRDRERLVGLGADRAEGHRPGDEPADELGGGLDLLEGNRGPLAVELEQRAQGAQPLGLVVGDLLVVGVRLRVVGAGGVLQLRDRRRVPLVDLAAAAPLVAAAGDGDLEVERADPAEAAGVALGRFPAQLGQPDPFQPRGGAVEVAIDQRPVEADRLEDLRAAVRLHGADPHLRHDLQQPLVHRVNEVVLGRLFGDRDLLAAGERAHGVERQPGSHRRGAVADQQREVVDLARFGGLDHQAGVAADAVAHQPLVDRRDGEQRGDRRVGAVDAAIGQHEDVGAFLDRFDRRSAQPLDRFLERALGLAGVEHREDLGLEVAFVAQREDPGEVGSVEDRPRQGQLVALLGRLFEGVAVGAERGAQRHHQRLADRIDRRVGHLREQLVEVVE
ncbi:MAG: hypothetical protein H6Q89_5549, partial [Myxococcaceae bacterium]|nr:hypothetical protein [Myxococcaceae bacterium]